MAKLFLVRSRQPEHGQFYQAPPGVETRGAQPPFRN